MPVAADVERIVPGGTAPPADIPEAIFEAALRRMLALERIDMTAIADELGVTRMTVWRRAGNRDNLLGEILWFLSRQLYAQAIIDTGDAAGVERVLGVGGRFIALVHAREDFRAFLRFEADRALALLTTPRTSLQARIVGMCANLLEVEAERGALRLTMPQQDLAYALIRIGESFLYSDLIAGVEPDLARAEQIMRRVLEPERP